MAEYKVRKARQSELDLLPDLELAAGKRFAEIGMPAVAEAPLLNVETLRAALALDLLWVVADANDRAVGFAVVELLDEHEAHLDEMSVHPDYGRHGLGKRLLDAVVVWARASGIRTLTLSTFRKIPWNGPWYLAYGFRELTPEELTPAMREIRAREAAAGLDVRRRAFMRLDL